MIDSLAIYGPPGTGKTYQLGKIIDQYAQEEDLKDLAVLAYSKATALELVSRLPSERLGFIGTIHSFCFRMLKLSKSDVVRMKDFYKIMHNEPVMIDRCINILNYSAKTNRTLSEAYDYLLKKGNPINMMPIPIVNYVVDSYINWKSNNLLYDFEDMLKLAKVRYNAGGGINFPMVIVDEAQDLSPLQWDVVTKIPTKNMILAGDDDQAIFEWSGANPHGMLENSTRSMVLDQSHRIPRAVHRVATKLISTLENRIEKKFNPIEQEGYFSILPSYSYDDHPDGHIVLCRDKFIINNLTHHLMKCGVTYAVLSGRNPGPLIGKYGIVARAIHNRDNIKEKFKPWMLKYISEPLRRNLNAFLLDNSVDIIKYNLEDVLEAPPVVLKYLYLLGVEIFRKPQVYLSTIHAQKGREYDHVVIIGDSSPASNQFTDAEIRVWYVAMTRAKKGATFVNPHSFLDITAE